jgi:hypothetical protein
VLALFYLGFGGAGLPAGPSAPARPIAEHSTLLQESSADRSKGDEIAVGSALRNGGYPWYDPATGRVKSVRDSWLSRPRKQLARMWKSFLRWLDGLKFGRIRGFGNGVGSLGTWVLLCVLVGFLVALLLLWLRQDRISLGDRGGRRIRLGTAARLAELPEGIRPVGDDPWAEALAWRAAGDLSGATVCLFAHQLLCLDQMGLIRLAPGRTARQYVQGVRDPDFHGPVAATLGLFEDVYYGRRRPTRDAFEFVWIRALALEERRRVLGVSG